jgi:hypothetical protein
MTAVKKPGPDLLLVTLLTLLVMTGLGGVLGAQSSPPRPAGHNNSTLATATFNHAELRR